ncbi:hypothetical protein [Homoserinimonas aerilata]|uniref:hypothetical protein n=1 Tax=Homoserinimonas aerilata TaxID=1162970 RepID=UPI001FE95040|nr:hypothetical protein [Homoserinimonas aerilata]
MELDDLLDALNAGDTITGDSPLHEIMHRISQDALRITGELNGVYPNANMTGFVGTY